MHDRFARVLVILLRTTSAAKGRDIAQRFKLMYETMFILNKVRFLCLNLIDQQPMSLSDIVAFAHLHIVATQIFYFQTNEF